MKFDRIKTHIILFLVQYLVQYLVANVAVEYPKFFGMSGSWDRTIRQMEKIEIFVKIQNCLIWRKTGELSSTMTSSKYWTHATYRFKHTDYIYQNKSTGHWHVQALINPDIDTEKCEIGQNENHTEYRRSKTLTDIHHPHNLTKPKEESWIDLYNPTKKFKIFSFNFDKKTGFSQTISGYEVFSKSLSEYKGKCILEHHKIF